MWWLIVLLSYEYKSVNGPFSCAGLAEGDAGEELRAIGQNEVHSPGGSGHNPIRLALDPGDFHEPQVPAEPRGRGKAGLRETVA